MRGKLEIKQTTDTSVMQEHITASAVRVDDLLRKPGIEVGTACHDLSKESAEVGLLIGKDWEIFHHPERIVDQRVDMAKVAVGRQRLQSGLHPDVGHGAVQLGQGRTACCGLCDIAALGMLAADDREESGDTAATIVLQDGVGLPSMRRERQRHGEGERSILEVQEQPVLVANAARVGDVLVDPQE